MLGRDRELTRLRDSLERAVAERTVHRAAVLRPAGLGKSRLAREPAPVAGDQRRDSMWAVRRFFEAVAQERPAVIVFEDVHWADAALLDLIEFVTQSSSGAPLLLLCLAREEFVEQRPDWGKDGARASAMRLGRLSDADTAALIDDLDHDGALGPG